MLEIVVASILVLGVVVAPIAYLFKDMKSQQDFYRMNENNHVANEVPRIPSRDHEHRSKHITSYDRADLDDVVLDIHHLISAWFWIFVLAGVVGAAWKGYLLFLVTKQNGVLGGLIGGVLGMIGGWLTAWVTTRPILLIVHTASAVGKVEEHLAQIRERNSGQRSDDVAPKRTA